LKKLNANQFMDLMLKIKCHSDKIEEDLKKELSHYSWSCFYDPMCYAIEGGKRIRPLILTLAAESVGNGGEDPSLAAVAVELLHTESIIHDDIIDQSKVKDLKPTVFGKFGRACFSRKSAPASFQKT